MPIFEYKCRACGIVSENLSNSDDAPISITKECPMCRLPAVMDKQLSSGSFRISGDGVYKPTSTFD